MGFATARLMAAKTTLATKPTIPRPLFSWPLIYWSLMQGLLAFALVAIIFVVALNRGMPESEVRGLAFFSLVTTIVGLILVNRSFSASLITQLFVDRTPMLVRILALGNGYAEFSPSLAVLERALPLWAIASGRSRGDAWRRLALPNCRRLA